MPGLEMAVDEADDVYFKPFSLGGCFPASVLVFPCLSLYFVHFLRVPLSFLSRTISLLLSEFYLV